MSSKKRKESRLTGNMRILSFFLIFFFSLVSCQKKQKIEKPNDLIPQEKMVDVLTEMSLLHGARSYNRTVLADSGVKMEKFIWEKYDIDSLQFLNSNNYYADNYLVYENIYNKVKERLEIMKVRYDSIREENERMMDSLRELDGGDSLLELEKPLGRDSLLIKKADSVGEGMLPMIRFDENLR